MLTAEVTGRRQHAAFVAADVAVDEGHERPFVRVVPLITRLQERTHECGI
jgi:hypothetical protein